MKSSITGRNCLLKREKPLEPIWYTGYEYGRFYLISRWM